MGFIDRIVDYLSTNYDSDKKSEKDLKLEELNTFKKTDKVYFTLKDKVKTIILYENHLAYYYNKDPEKERRSYSYNEIKNPIWATETNIKFNLNKKEFLRIGFYGKYDRYIDINKSRSKLQAFLKALRERYTCYVKKTIDIYDKYKN